MVVGESGEVLDAHIDPDILACFLQGERFDFAGDGNIPSIGFTTDGAGFGSALQRSMQANRNIADLGQMQEIAFDLGSRAIAGIGEGAIPSCSLETWKAWFLQP
jgi:hypothetical protein